MTGIRASQKEQDLIRLFYHTCDSGCFYIDFLTRVHHKFVFQSPRECHRLFNLHTSLIVSTPILHGGDMFLGFYQRRFFWPDIPDYSVVATGELTTITVLSGVRATFSGLRPSKFASPGRVVLLPLYFETLFAL